MMFIINLNQLSIFRLMVGEPVLPPLEGSYLLKSVGSKRASSFAAIFLSEWVEARPGSVLLRTIIT